MRLSLPVVAAGACVLAAACSESRADVEAPPPEPARGVAAAVQAAALRAATTPRDDGADAEAFVRRLYASYSDDPQSRPQVDQGLDSVWSRRMAGLIRRDTELAAGDMPYLDADPICNCQDWENLSVRAVTLEPPPDGALVATVRFVNGGEETTTVLRLVREAAGWRVDDVINPYGYPGLAEAIAESNRRLEAGR